jgi:guanylate kinase
MEEKEQWTHHPQKLHAEGHSVPFMTTATHKEKQYKIKSYIQDLFTHGPGYTKQANEMEKSGFVRGVVYTGVLQQDVESTMLLNTIPLIEVQSLHTARVIHDCSGIDCNFIFV